MISEQLKEEIKDLVNKSFPDFYIKDIKLIEASNANQEFTKESVVCIFIENQKSDFNIRNEQLIDVVKSILDHLNDKNSFKEILVLYDDKNGNLKESREFKLTSDQFTLPKQEMIKLIKLKK